MSQNKQRQKRSINKVSNNVGDNEPLSKKRKLDDYLSNIEKLCERLCQKGLGNNDEVNLIRSITDSDFQGGEKVAELLFAKLKKENSEENVKLFFTFLSNVITSQGSEGVKGFVSNMLKLGADKELELKTFVSKLFGAPEEIIIKLLYSSLYQSLDNKVIEDFFSYISTENEMDYAWLYKQCKAIYSEKEEDFKKIYQEKNEKIKEINPLSGGAILFLLSCQGKLSSECNPLLQRMQEIKKRGAEEKAEEKGDAVLLPYYAASLFHASVMGDFTSFQRIIEYMGEEKVSQIYKQGKFSLPRILAGALINGHSEFIIGLLDWVRPLPHPSYIKVDEKSPSGVDSSSRLNLTQKALANKLDEIESFPNGMDEDWGYLLGLVAEKGDSTSFQRIVNFINKEKVTSYRFWKYCMTSAIVFFSQERYQKIYNLAQSKFPLLTENDNLRLDILESCFSNLRNAQELEKHELMRRIENMLINFPAELTKTAYIDIDAPGAFSIYKVISGGLHYGVDLFYYLLTSNYMRYKVLEKAKYLKRFDSYTRNSYFDLWRQVLLKIKHISAFSPEIKEKKNQLYMVLYVFLEEGCENAGIKDKFFYSILEDFYDDFNAYKESKEAEAFLLQLGKKSRSGPGFFTFAMDTLSKKDYKDRKLSKSRGFAIESHFDPNVLSIIRDFSSGEPASNYLAGKHRAGATISKDVSSMLVGKEEEYVTEEVEHTRKELESFVEGRTIQAILPRCMVDDKELTKGTCVAIEVLDEKTQTNKWKDFSGYYVVLAAIASTKPNLKANVNKIERAQRYHEVYELWNSKEQKDNIKWDDKKNALVMNGLNVLSKENIEEWNSFIEEANDKTECKEACNKLKAFTDFIKGKVPNEKLEEVVNITYFLNTSEARGYN